MRQTTDALLKNGISMPDEAREVIFPKGLPVHPMTPPQEGSAPTAAETEQAATSELTDDPVTAAEGGLARDEVLMEEPTPSPSEARENLLTGSASPTRPTDR